MNFSKIIFLFLFVGQAIWATDSVLKVSVSNYPWVHSATVANTASAIVKRDINGDFSANLITANLVGNVTGNLSGNASTATTATNANNFTGSLVGDITGTQGATVVSSIGGQSVSDITVKLELLNNITTSSTANSMVRRDSSGNFAANLIAANILGNLLGNATTATTADSATTAASAATAANFSGSLSGDVTGTQGATVVSAVGGQSASNIAAAAVLANAATNLNTASAIVKRDSSGNFVANTITASLVGNVTGNLTGNVTGNLSGHADTATTCATATNNLLKAGDTMSGTLVLAGLVCNQAIQSVTPTNNGSVSANSTTAILLLNHNSNISNYTINFPASPTNGQLFTIMLGTTNSISFSNTAPAGAAIVNGITTLDPSPLLGEKIVSVTYLYTTTNNSWYRYQRG
jgi:hypothetical protein